MDDAPLILALPDLDATRALGRRLLGLLRPGDVVGLSGDLGAGKTELARAVIQAALGPDEEAPSPTFTLAQTYELETATLWHYDLYRLAAPDDALELGIEEAFADGIVLIEWPERLGGWLPSERLDVTLTLTGRGEERTAVLIGRGDGWNARLKKFGETL